MTRLSLLFTFAAVAVAVAAPAPQWGVEPLGAPAPQAASEPAAIQRPLRSHYRATLMDAPPLELIRDGQATVLLVLPAEPTESETQAANLLRELLSAIGGCEFAIAAEYSLTPTGDGALQDAKGHRWPGAIWIGNTRRAAAEKLSAEGLPPEGFRRVRKGNHLFILGNDHASLPVKGTFFGAADLAERHFGVRWLWPGPGGTVIPPRTSLTLPPMDERDEPALPQRIIRNNGVGERSLVGLKLLQKEGKDLAPVVAMNRAWLDRQKTGSSIDLQYRHAFGDWYTKYGAQHPDWFAMRPGGSREQFTERPRLCKSNPEVAHQAALQVLAQYEANPNLDSASISPNDGSGVDGFCLCAECRKLDPPNGRKVRLLVSPDGKKREYVEYVSLSDRFATFYNQIAQEVAKKNPKARLGAYAYSAYRDVPLNVTLHPSIVIGFVGLDYTNEALRQSDLERWDGWSRRASHLLLRPNALHGGEGLPLLYPHRLAADVRHCYQTGMLAADFDSLTSHWATQGLNYYLLAKLLWDPSADVDALIADYCQSGFGPAAEKMAAFYALVEEKSAQTAGAGRQAVEAQLREEEDDTPDARAREGKTFRRAYFAAFTPEVMARLRALLDEAGALTANDEAIVARLRFLRTGLDYSDRVRRLVDSDNAMESRREMLEWYRTTFATEPLAINAPARLWRTGALYRKLSPPTSKKAH